jgi:hypothetical protein
MARPPPGLIRWEYNVINIGVQTFARFRAYPVQPQTRCLAAQAPGKGLIKSGATLSTEVRRPAIWFIILFVDSLY